MTIRPPQVCLPDRSRAMPPVRTLLFLVPLVKALRPSTTPAKQLSTASSMKARVASQKAGHDRGDEHKHAKAIRYAERMRTGVRSTSDYKPNKFSVEYHCC